MKAGAIDGNNSISCYIYSCKSAVVNIFKSNAGSIITKIGATEENLVLLKKMVSLMREEPSHPIEPFSHPTMMVKKPACVDSEKAARLRAIAQELDEMTPETLRLLSNEA